MSKNTKNAEKPNLPDNFVMKSICLEYFFVQCYYECLRGAWRASAERESATGF
jgi:hypothetical protein